jgi:hypothetical protein
MKSGTQKWVAFLMLLLTSVVAVGWKLASSDASQPTLIATPPRSDLIAPVPKPNRPEASKASVLASQSMGTQPAVARKPKSPTDLLTEFELTGDRTLLVQARKLFPHDKRVIMASCLTATDPKSTWLAELEKTEPDNTLPNLVRAALLAKKGDIKGFVEEMKKASGKTSLDTMMRDRQAELLDRIIMGKGVLPRSLFGTTDSTFFKNLEVIYKTYTSNPSLFGDELEAATTSVALATTFRKMSSLGFSYSHYGNFLELGMLEKVPGDVEYGDQGQTVAQRNQELRMRVAAGDRKLEQFHKLITAPDADPILRLQYYARMRSDGEEAALQWLLARYPGT